MGEGEIEGKVEEKEREEKEEPWKFKVDRFILEDLEAGVEELNVNVVVKKISDENVRKLEKFGLKNVKVLTLASTISGIASKFDIVKIAELSFVEKIYKNMEVKPLNKEGKEDK